MSIKFIAQELLGRIFGLLKRNDLRSCMLVCKHWRRTISPLYFQQLFIHEGYLKINQAFEYGHLAKELKLYGQHRYFPDGLRKQDFLSLLSYLPNLVKLDLSTSPYYIHYMRFMREEYQNIHLKHLEEIVYRKGPLKNLDYHFFACYKYRKSIQRLEVHDFLNSTEKEKSKSLLYYLPHFTCLTYLKIDGCCQETDLTLFDILLCCENITELDYQSKHQVPFRARRQVGTTKNKYLKKLTLGLLWDSTMYLDYIRFYSKCLESLTLIIQGNVYAWFETFLSFAGDLKRFQNLVIQSDEKPIKVSKYQTKSFYDFLFRLKGDRHLQYNATFCSEKASLQDIIHIADDKMKFVYYSNDKFPTYFTDPQGIIKILRLDALENISPSTMLNYASTTFCSLVALFIVISKETYLKVTHDTIQMHGFSISQNIFDQLHDYSPYTEVIASRKCVGTLQDVIYQPGLKATMMNTSCVDDNISNTMFNFEAFTHLKTFVFDLKHLNSSDFDFVFIFLNFGDTIDYYRIYYHRKEFYIQKVKEEFVLESPQSDSSIVTFKFCNRSVKVYFSD